MAGLTAASELQQRGHEVLVVDKGRGVGGRMASRRIGPATFDHGAQFMTARDRHFVAAIEVWRTAGAVKEWYRRAPGGSGAHPRWRGQPAMTAVPKYLARDLAVRLGSRVLALRREAGGWVAALESGESVSASGVVLTTPVPQALVLLDVGQVDLPWATRARLESLEYERCLAVLAVLAAPSQIPPPGGLALEEGPIAWLADNQRKGVSATPAVTLHATPSYSRAHWDQDRQVCGRALLDAAEPWLGAGVEAFQVHGWRYAKPVRVEEDGFLVLSEGPPLLLAGDAFAAPRVEGAALSGWRAAEQYRRLAGAGDR
jgi:predicted NAD/FAD-dependent oxidoreductase